MNKKTAILIVVTVIAVVFWLSLVPWLKGGARFAEIQAWLPPLVMLTIVSGSMSLAVVLLDQKRLWVLMAFLVALPVFLVFGLHYIFLIYVGFSMISILFTGYSMKRELAERYKVDMRVMTRAGIRYVMLPLLIGVSFVYFFSPQVQQRAHTDAFPLALEQTIAKGIQQFMESGAVEDRTIGSKFTPQAVHQGFQRINESFEPYVRYFPPLFSFGLFIILWSAIFLFDWLGTQAAVAMFSILKRHQFVRIEEREVKAETIKL